MPIRHLKSQKVIPPKSREDAGESIFQHPSPGEKAGGDSSQAPALPQPPHSTRSSLSLKTPPRRTFSGDLDRHCPFNDGGEHTLSERGSTSCSRYGSPSRLHQPAAPPLASPHPLSLRHSPLPLPTMESDLQKGTGFYKNLHPFDEMQRALEEDRQRSDMDWNDAICQELRMQHPPSSSADHPASLNGGTEAEGSDDVGPSIWEGRKGELPLKVAFQEKPKRVLIVKRIHSPHVSEVAVALAWFLHKEMMVDVVVEPSAAEDFVERGAGMVKTWPEDVPSEEIGKHVDFAIAIGGDGTMLWISHLLSDVVPPIVGFSMGSLGYLTQFQMNEAQALLRRMVECGTFHIWLRSRLRVLLLDANNRILQEYTAINECVIDRGDASTLACLDVYCNEGFFTNVTADGLIVATPTGSTAYSMSAGGSMVHPSVPCMLFTPICPHSLSFRPLILPDSAVLRVRVPEDGRGSASVAVDGRGRREVKKGHSVIITMSAFPYPMVCREDGFKRDLWIESLQKSLNWNLRIRQQDFSSPPRCSGYLGLHLPLLGLDGAKTSSKKSDDVSLDCAGDIQMSPQVGGVHSAHRRSIAGRGGRSRETATSPPLSPGSAAAEGPAIAIRDYPHGLSWRLRRHARSNTHSGNVASSQRVSSSSPFFSCGKREEPEGKNRSDSDFGTSGHPIDGDSKGETPGQGGDNQDAPMGSLDLALSKRRASNDNDYYTSGRLGSSSTPSNETGGVGSGGVGQRLNFGESIKYVERSRTDYAPTLEAVLESLSPVLHPAGESPSTHHIPESVASMALDGPSPSDSPNIWCRSPETSVRDSMGGGLKACSPLPSDLPPSLPGNLSGSFSSRPDFQTSGGSPNSSRGSFGMIVDESSPCNPFTSSKPGEYRENLRYRARSSTPPQTVMEVLGGSSVSLPSSSPQSHPVSPPSAPSPTAKGGSPDSTLQRITALHTKMGSSHSPSESEGDLRAHMESPASPAASPLASKRHHGSSMGVHIIRGSSASCPYIAETNVLARNGRLSEGSSSSALLTNPSSLPSRNASALDVRTVMENPEKRESRRTGQRNTSRRGKREIRPSSSSPSIFIMPEPEEQVPMQLLPRQDQPHILKDVETAKSERKKSHE